MIALVTVQALAGESIVRPSVPFLVAGAVLALGALAAGMVVGGVGRLERL